MLLTWSDPLSDDERPPVEDPPLPQDERPPVDDAELERRRTLARRRFFLFNRARAYCQERAGAAALRRDADIGRAIANARSRSPDPSPARSRSRSSRRRSPIGALAGLADDQGVAVGVDEDVDEEGNHQGVAVGWSAWRDCRRTFGHLPCLRGLGLHHDDEGEPCPGGGPFLEGEHDNTHPMTDLCV